MALPAIFNARVRTSVVPQAPRRIADSGLAQGLSVLGRAGADAVERDARITEAEQESAHRIEQEELRRDRARRAMTFGAQLSEARIEYAKRAEEARGTTEPGAPGWEGRAREIASEVFSPLASLYADDEELATHLAPQLQNVAANLIANEVAWEARQRTEWEGSQFETALNGEADALLSNPTPEALAEAEERLFGQLALTDYDGTTKAKLAVGTRGRLVRSVLDGMANAGQFDGMAALLEAGTFDGVLGDDKDNYLRTVAAGRQAQARAAEIAASEARDAAREQLDLIKVRIENGDFPTQSEIHAAIAAGKAADVPVDELAGYAFLGEEAVNGQQFRTMGDGALQDEIAALRARESAGRLDAAGQRRLDQAEKALGNRDGAKAENLRTLWSSGPEGQAQAVQQLATMAPDRAWAAASRAGNTRMAIYARLSPNGQREAIEGRRLREDKQRGDDFLPRGAGGKADKAAAEQRFRAFIGEPLMRQLGGAYGDVFETALDVMAGTGGEWNEANFLRAVRVVFGANRRPDGTLQGGIGTVRGRVVELPDDMTAAEFDRALSRGDFSGARYRNGQAASKADVLANFQPVPVSARQANGRTRYTFVDAQEQPLLGEDGRTPYQFDAFKVR